MWAHRTNFWRLRLNFFREKIETHSLRLRNWPKLFSKNFFPGIAIGHLWFSFDEPAENMLTNGRKRMGSVSEHDSKNCFFSRIKVFFLRKCPWTCILQFDNSARKSPIKYQKILDQSPKVTIKFFPTKFSSKRNWTFWMQFWQIHARKFQKWQTHGPMFEINKKNIFSQKNFLPQIVSMDTHNAFLTTILKSFQLKMEQSLPRYRSIGKKQFFFKTKNILLQIVPLDA